MKILRTTIMIMMVVLLECVDAANRTVGGSTGWSLSSDITQWSSSTSCFVNDSLVFLYTPDYDVIEVSRADFVSCQISSPIATYDDGETVILLSQRRTRYFVCGRPRHCSMGLKLRVAVLDQPSPQSGNNPGSNSTMAKPGSPQASSGGSDGNRTSHDRNGSSPSKGCKSVGFVTLGSYLLHLGVSFLVFENHLA